jgi:hypothetical protein
MEMDSALVRFSALSALIGFAAFCAAQSLQVWRRRNKAAAAKQGRARGGGRLARWSAAALVLGGLGMAGGVALREVAQPEGLLKGDGLFAVRAPDDAEVTFLAAEGEVKPGEVLARFHSPALEEEAEAARLRLERLRAERRVLELQPLVLDPELVRRHDRAAADGRQLLAVGYMLLPAQASIVRDALQASLAKREQMTRLDVDLNAARREVDQVAARRLNSQQKLTRDQALYERRVIPAADLEERERDARIFGAEAAKVRDRLEDLQKERRGFEEHLSRVEALAAEQGGMLRREAEQTRQEMAAVRKAENAVAARLADDEARARRLRGEELRRLDVRIAEAEVALAGARQRQAAAAPFAGHVAFRAPAPRAARRQEPLLVLSPGAGFRLEVRLPAGQVEALRAAGTVSLEADGARLERRFSGELLRARALAHEPSTVVAELECRPSGESVKALAEGEKVPVRLLWRPPLETVLPFQAGAVLALAGALGWLVGRPGTGRGAPPRPAPARPSAPPASASPAALAGPHRAFGELPPAPNGAPADVEFGRQGHLLRGMGVRLREGILRGEAEPALLGALEWALDRHHARAVRLLSEGLGSDPELAERAEALLLRLGKDSGPDGLALAGRLAAVLRVVGPEVVPARG